MPTSVTVEPYLHQTKCKSRAVDVAVAVATAQNAPRLSWVPGAPPTQVVPCKRCAPDRYPSTYYLELPACKKQKTPKIIPGGPPRMKEITPSTTQKMGRMRVFSCCWFTSPPVLPDLWPWQSRSCGLCRAHRGMLPTHWPLLPSGSCAGSQPISHKFPSQQETSQR